jgi:hypothetical protein
MVIAVLYSLLTCERPNQKNKVDDAKVAMAKEKALYINIYCSVDRFAKDEFIFSSCGQGLLQKWS